MPFNGAGTFQRVYSWATDAANGILVRSDRMDTEMNGFATGLSDCITRDGQSPALADLPMSGFRLLNWGGATGTNINIVGTNITLTATTLLDLSSSISLLVPTPTAGDNSNKAASTAFVNGVAMSSALPGQANNAGKYVRTNGSVASFEILWGKYEQERSVRRARQLIFV